ncbi:MAG: lytic murein transglycosylase [Burkholderiales bacterium]|nr:lytic murein transglycosylase [Burkholderiales bacterium]
MAVALIGLPGSAAVAGAAPSLSVDDLQACMERLRPQAIAAGVSSASFAAHTATIKPEPSVLEKLDYQPEFKTAVWDYLAALVDDERVADGKAMLATHAATLAAVAQRYGVDAETVVAVWGVESNFGRAQGNYRLPQALATLACAGRRQTFFRGELFAALRILQGGHFAPEKLVGSWAGAFGQTQFMPSTFERLAVDFDGDGRKDLIDSAADALGSTANYLKQAGWRTAQPWGVEVKLPAAFDAGLVGRTKRRPLAAWQALGVVAIDGKPLSASVVGEGDYGLLLPGLASGAQLPTAGPAFLVGRNFDAIYSYNASESYGLAIAHLADRLRGRGAFLTPWPIDDRGLSRTERRELQRLLAARGHDIGEVDGLLGEKSRVAVRAEQTRLGMRVTGRAGEHLLARLRQTSTQPASR